MGYKGSTYKRADNGTYVFVDDPNEQVTISANTTVNINNGIIRGNDFHNNALTQGGASGQDIRSGTYTPTLTNVSNSSNLVAYTSQWMRVGNVVTVSGRVSVDPTNVSTNTQFRLTIPISYSNMFGINRYILSNDPCRQIRTVKLGRF